MAAVSAYGRILEAFEGVKKRKKELWPARMKTTSSVHLQRFSRRVHTILCSRNWHLLYQTESCAACRMLYEQYSKHVYSVSNTVCIAYRLLLVALKHKDLKRKTSTRILLIDAYLLTIKLFTFTQCPYEKSETNHPHFKNK